MDDRERNAFQQLARLAAGNCPSLASLGEFIDNELESEQRQLIENHLQTCPYCVNRLIDLRELARMDASTNWSPVAIFGRFVPWIRPDKRRGSSGWPWSPIGIGIAALGVVALLFLVFGPGYLTFWRESIHRGVAGEPGGGGNGTGVELAVRAFSAAPVASDAFASRLLASLAALPNNHLPEVTRGAVDEQVYRNAAPATVLIQADLGNGNASLGSGCVLTPDGKILTNDHVIRGARRIVVFFFPQKKGQSRDAGFSATVIKDDPQLDLALLKVATPPPDLAYLQLGSLAKVQVGEDVYAIGHPEGLTWTYTRGIVSAVRNDFQWDDKQSGIRHHDTLIQTQVPINPGNSGGPLLNDRAELLGVNTFEVDPGIYGAVAVDTVQKFLAQPSSGTGITPAPPPAEVGREARASERYGNVTCVYLHRETPPPDLWLVYRAGERQPAYGGEASGDPARVDRVIVPADPNWDAYVVYLDTSCSGDADILAYRDASGGTRYERPPSPVPLTKLAPDLKRLFAEPNFPYFQKVSFCQ